MHGRIIASAFGASNDRTGNLPVLPGILPVRMAPIVRNGADGERELVMACWSMPGSPQFGGAPITNIRTVSSPHWRGASKTAASCQQPRFANTPIRSRKTPKWFALNRDDSCSHLLVYGPLGAALGAQERGSGWATRVVRFPHNRNRPIHSKAMPVILTTPAEVD
jgi:putative SOS response-associated peptidase YedK